MIIWTAWLKFSEPNSSLDGIVTAMLHSLSSSSSRPVRSLPKTIAIFWPSFFSSGLPVILSAKAASSSGNKSLPCLFFPLRLVVPAAKAQSFTASLMESKKSAFW